MLAGECGGMERTSIKGWVDSPVLSSEAENWTGVLETLLGQLRVVSSGEVVSREGPELTE